MWCAAATPEAGAAQRSTWWRRCAACTSAVERINAENRTLRLQNRKLTTDSQQLTERIKAARENNRFLDTRIARLEADLAESLLAGQRAPAQPS